MISIKNKLSNLYFLYFQTKIISFYVLFSVFSIKNNLSNDLNNIISIENKLSNLFFYYISVLLGIFQYEIILICI